MGVTNAYPDLDLPARRRGGAMVAAPRRRRVVRPEWRDVRLVVSVRRDDQGGPRLSALDLSWALLYLSAGLFVGAVAGRLLRPRRRAAVLAGFGIVIYCAGMALPGQARSVTELGLGLVVAALGNGLLAVSAAFLGNQLATAWGRRLQGCLSGSLTAGELLGSAAATAAVDRGVTARDYLLGVAAAGTTVALLVCLVLFLTRRPAAAHASAAPTAGGNQPSTASGTFVRPGLLVLLALVALSGYVGEGAIGDWGGPFLHEEVRASLSQAAFVYTVFASCSAGSRFLSDHLADRVGAHRVARYGAIVALVGAAAFVSAHDPVMGLIGAGVFGAGIGPIFPLAMSAAGTDEAAVSWIPTMSYLALTVAPPLIGFVASHKGLRFAIGALGAMALVALMLSGSLRHRLPLPGLLWRYHTPLGRSLAELLVLAHCAATARARLRLTVTALASGSGALTVEQVRRPKVVDIDDELDGGVHIRPQSASNVRRRRDRGSMLALVELPGRLVALEVVRVGTGPRRFVVWKIGTRCAVSSHERAEDALAAFEAALEVEWRRIWKENVLAELEALRRGVKRLIARCPRRAPLVEFTCGADGKAQLICPNRDDLEQRHRATACAFPLPDGQVIALRWYRLSRGSRPRLALLDSSRAGEQVDAFTGVLGERLHARLEPFETPHWLMTPEKRVTTKQPG
jgi:fucose permease